MLHTLVVGAETCPLQICSHIRLLFSYQSSKPCLFQNPEVATKDEGVGRRKCRLHIFLCFYFFFVLMLLAIFTLYNSAGITGHSEFNEEIQYFVFVFY